MLVPGVGVVATGVAVLGGLGTLGYFGNTSITIDEEKKPLAAALYFLEEKVKDKINYAIFRGKYLELAGGGKALIPSPRRVNVVLRNDSQQIISLGDMVKDPENMDTGTLYREFYRVGKVVDGRNRRRGYFALQDTEGRVWCCVGLP